VISAHPLVRATSLPLLVVSLAFSVACRADEPAPVADAPATVGDPPPATAPHRHGPARHLTVAQSIDESVRRLTRALDLDSLQQTRLRQILLDQHRQVLQLRSGNAAGPVDVTGTTMAIYEQTKARIRAMLNDDQKKKYPADVPRDSLAPAQADLQHWMQLQDSKRKQDDSATP